MVAAQIAAQRRLAGRRGGASQASDVVFNTLSFDNADSRFSLVNASTLKGSTAMTIGVAFYLPDITTSNDYVLSYRLNGITRGWAMRFNTSSVFNCFVFNGSATLVNAPNYTFVEGDEDKFHFACMVRETSTLRLYMNGVQVGTGTSITGYTAPNTSDALQAGGLASFSNLTQADILGFGGSSTTALDASQVSAWYDDIKAANDMVAMPTGNEATWKASSNIEVDAWVDEDAQDTLAKVNTPTAVQYLNKEWA